MVDNRIDLLVRDLIEKFGQGNLATTDGMRGVQISGRDLFRIDRPDIVEKIVAMVPKGVKFHSVRQIPMRDAWILVFTHPLYKTDHYPDIPIWLLTPEPTWTGLWKLQ